jgi:hypothetical protein
MKKYELNAYGKVEKTREKRRDFPTFPQALLIYFLNVKWVGYGSMTQIITSPENPARFRSSGTSPKICALIFAREPLP